LKHVARHHGERVVLADGDSKALGYAFHRGAVSYTWPGFSIKCSVSI